MSESLEASRPLKVFYSYAHEDEQLCRGLRKHLKLLERQGLVDSCYDRMIGVGGEKWKEINTHLHVADIILLLISASFLASDYCSIEMQQALDRHQRGDAQVIPIILRSVDWTHAPFSSLQVLPMNGIPVASSSRRDRDEVFASIAKNIRGVIEAFTHKPSQCFPHSPGLQNIPYRRNAIFTGRKKILQQIHESFFAETTLTLPQALCGLGGIGKTQIALEYAYSHLKRYRDILWVKANTRDMLILGYMAIADSLDIGNKKDQDQEHIIAAVKRWLAKNRNWLLVLDDVDEIALIHDFLPIEPDGHILLTTRSQAVGTFIQKIQVEEMSMEEGEQFLLRRTRVLSAGSVANEISASERSNARDVVLSLRGLPLALDQAGGYIEETACGIATYLSRYRDHQASLLQRRGSFGEDHPEPVTTTWSLSFKRVEQANSSAANLLKFCAFLSPDAIPEELLSASEAEHNLQPIAHDSFLLDEAIGVLLRFSFVKRNNDGNNTVLSIHPLIQAALKASMSYSEKHKWAEYAVIAVSRAFPEFSYENRNRCQQYLPHAMICSQLIAEYELVLSEAVQLLNRAGSYLYGHAVYGEAEGLFLKALAISENVSGPEDLETANCLNKLAELYYMRFKQEKAESLWKRALAIRESIVGAEHPDTAEILDNLGVLYYVQATYTQAENLYARALEIREKQLGLEHKDTGQTLNNMGVLYHAQRKFVKAEAFYRRSRAIAEREFGSEHPLTAHSLDCLAKLYHDQGKFEQAEPLYQRALAIREKEPGPEHPRTAGSLGNLGEFYYDQGCYDQAVVYSRRALEIMQTMFGSDHPNTAIYCGLLAKIYGAQRLYEEAAVLYQKALSTMEKALGVSHPITVKCLHECALFYQKQEKREQAASLYSKALSVSHIPSNHSAVLDLLKDYALLLRDLGELEKIEEIEDQIRSLQNSLC